MRTPGHAIFTISSLTDAEVVPFDGFFDKVEKALALFQTSPFERPPG
ncbi:MAG: hypothetical protein RQ833_08095 [Sphingomonadaceae bacterium]|nr:hypothetical protein [Sphingomonadaceae bacterium]